MHEFYNMIRMMIENITEKVELFQKTNHLPDQVNENAQDRQTYNKEDSERRSE